MKRATDAPQSTDLSPLPLGWKWARLEEIAADEPNAITDGPFGSKLKTVHYTESGPRVVRLQNIGDGEFVDARAHISDDHFAALKKHCVGPNDLLVAALGESLPRSCIAPETLGPAIVKADCIRVRVRHDVSVRYVNFALSNEGTRRRVAKIVHGVGRPRLNLSEIKSITIPLPPLAEQQRIVAEIEKQLTRLEAGVAALRHAQANLKRYRAAVLKAACEGRLVPTEADLARREGREYEDGRHLLARVLSERLARYKGAIRHPVNPSDCGPLPEGWCWASPSQLSAGESHSLAIGPFGSNLKVSDYRESGVPLVFVRNIRARRFGEDDVFVSAEKADTLRPHQVSAGDILITKMGDPPGDACIYPGPSPAVITADCIKLRLSPTLKQSRFFVHAINSEVVRHQILSITKGVAQLKVSLGRFGAIGLPLPPLAEQHRIVAEVERRLSVVGEQESAVAVSLARAARLRQAILQRAFSGELVPPEPAA